MRYIRVLSELSNQVRYATQKRVLIEVALIKLCRPAMETNYDSILDRIRVLEKMVEQGIPAAPAPASKATEAAPVKRPVTEETLEALQKAIPEDLQQLAKNWDRICGLASGSVKAYLQKAVPTVGEGNSLLLLYDDPMAVGHFENNPDHVEEVKDVIQRQIQKEVQVKVKLMENTAGQKEDMLDLSKFSKMTIEIED